MPLQVKSEIPVQKLLAPKRRDKNPERQIRSHREYMLRIGKLHADNMNHRTENTADHKRQNNQFPAKQQSCRRHQLNIATADPSAFCDKVNQI